jgi:hypothetical protein
MYASLSLISSPDIPFGPMELCEIRRSVVDLSLQGALFRVRHSYTAKVVGSVQADEMGIGKNSISTDRG